MFGINWFTKKTPPTEPVPMGDVASLLLERLADDTLWELKRPSEAGAWTVYTMVYRPDPDGLSVSIRTTDGCKFYYENPFMSYHERVAVAQAFVKQYNNITTEINNKSTESYRRRMLRALHNTTIPDE